MECIILAGGLGTRLRSVVSDLPKCMASVAGQPFLHYIFKYLESQHVDHVILSVGYKYEVIEEWVRKKAWSFKISYTIEDEPLGTGGAIQLAMKQTSETHILIMNGDTFFNIDLANLYSTHLGANADLTIALKPMTKFERYGNVVLDENHRIISFLEKQYCEAGQINGGTYLINRNTHLMDNLGLKFSFETDVLQQRFAGSYFIGTIHDSYFIDIGIPEDYEKANTEFKTLFL